MLTVIFAVLAFALFILYLQKSRKLKIQIIKRQRAEDDLQKVNEVFKQQIDGPLEHRTAQLTLINDIGNKIAAELELDKVLERTANLVQKMFNYHQCAFAFGHEAIIADQKRYSIHFAA